MEANTTTTENEMSTHLHYKITFEFTPETAAEAVARAGGLGTNDELREATDASRGAYRVRGNAVQRFIGDMWENGYRVVTMSLHEKE